jgi:Uma2 family endonuclease
MATATNRITVGPDDHGRPMSLDDFAEADFQEGWLYELARGVIVVTEVPGPNHGRIVMRLSRLFTLYDETHPGVINYRAGGGECRMRLPGMVCDRHPDQAIYLDHEPTGPKVWTRWIPHLVVEILSEGSEHRDYVEKREEYLRAGVSEYWIVDPDTRRLVVLSRAGDTWDETVVPAGTVHRTHLLPGLEVRPEDLLGPAGET